MEFKGPNKIRVTLSEAEWIAKQRPRFSMNLRVQIERGRRTVLQPFLPPGIFDGVPEVPTRHEDLDLKLRQFQAETGMRMALRRLLENSQDAEAHVIELDVNPAELVALRQQADIDHDIARNEVMNLDKSFDVYNEYTAGDETLQLTEDDQAGIKEMVFKDDIKTMQITKGIIHAIENQPKE